MYKITWKKWINSQISLVEIEAPDIAKSASAGQFVILRVDEKGERFPLTLYDWDAKEGKITVVCQAVGVSTKKFCALDAGDTVCDIAGPLGHGVDTKGIGKIICIGGGVGAAEIYPIAKAMKKDGNDVTVIIGARTKELVIFETEMKVFCDETYVATDDGSYGRKGVVTDVLNELTTEDLYDLVFAVGPLMMMKMVSEMAGRRSIKTLVSLNSIMIDGTGMCGGCRILYKNEAKFTCVDGPEFDGRLVDFDDLIKRQRRYNDKEKQALNLYEEKCRIGLTKKT